MIQKMIQKQSVTMTDLIGLHHEDLLRGPLDGALWHVFNVSVGSTHTFYEPLCKVFIALSLDP
jgi:hypothetical protein